MGAFDKLVKMKKDYETAVKKVGKDAVLEAFAAYFTAQPTVKAVRWEQYTPYFNDGEPCTFIADLDDAKLALVNGDENAGDDGDGFLDEGAFKGKAKKEFHDLFKGLPKIPEDVLLAVFGDHQQVTVTRDDDPLSTTCHIEHDEYEHD